MEGGRKGGREGKGRWEERERVGGRHKKAETIELHDASNSRTCGLEEGTHSKFETSE